jgi:hypothetical protein
MEFGIQNYYSNIVRTFYARVIDNCTLILYFVNRLENLLSIPVLYVVSHNTHLKIFLLPF